MKETFPDKKDSLALKILIPFIILCIVGGIWAAKHYPLKTVKNEETASKSDFVLNVEGTMDLEKLKTYHLPIIVEFGAEWCGYCQQMKPIIDALNKDLQGKAIVKYVDVDKNPRISSQYNFQTIPTQLLIDSSGNAYNPPNAAAMGMALHKDPGTGELLYTLHSGTLTKEELMEILTEMGMK